jgi:hypothetical protein
LVVVEAGNHVQLSWADNIEIEGDEGQTDLEEIDAERKEFS